MVIPVGGMGLESMSGPPPPELYHRFRIMKLCVVAMLCAVVGKLFAALLLDQFSTALAGSLNLVLNCVVGIFLLNEDEHLKSAYNFMMSTCFQPCADQCNGGMNCLLTWILCNLLTVVLDVLLYGSLQRIYVDFQALFSGIIPTAVASVAIFIHTVSAVAALLGQGIGAFQGWKAYGEARSIYSGTSSVPGSWAEEQHNAGAGSGAGGAGWGGGSGWGGGGDTGATRPAQNFAVFQGQGNRLGGD